MSIENNLKALRYQVDQLYKLAKAGKIEWRVVSDATTVRDRLHADAARVDNQIEQMIEAYSLIEQSAQQAVAADLLPPR